MSLSPTEMQLYNSLGTTTYETEKYISSARKLLLDFGDQMADQKRPQFLEGALDEYKTAASKGHSAFRGWGCFEALAGAFLWSILLIALTIIASRNGIDILEVYHRLAAH